MIHDGPFMNFEKDSIAWIRAGPYLDFIRQYDGTIIRAKLVLFPITVTFVQNVHNDWHQMFLNRFARYARTVILLMDIMLGSSHAK